MKNKWLAGDLIEREKKQKTFVWTCGEDDLQLPFATKASTSKLINRFDDSDKNKKKGPKN